MAYNNSRGRDWFGNPFSRGAPSAQRGGSQTFSRGSYRGRGSFSSSKPYHSRFVPSVQLDRRSFLDGLVEDDLQEIRVSNLKIITENMQVRDVKPIGSYNWVDSDDPIIIVPGSPACWLDRKPPFSVPPDTGLVWIDKSGVVLPRARMLALIVSVDKYTEETGECPFNWESQDIITGRNNLKKLFSWANEGTTPRDFRIDLQLAGKRTVLMNRWEQSMQDEMPGFTYGHNFERHTTRMPDECRNTSVHHRIIQYDFNGLKMVVRFELDGYLPETTAATQPTHNRSTSSGSTVLVDDLSDAVSHFHLESLDKFAGLGVVKGGTLVPQSRILELTTKSQRARTPIDYDRLYAQMLFSNTPNLIVAMYDSGQFNEIRGHTMDSPDLRSRQESMQPTLRRVGALLEYIQQKVIQHGHHGRLSLVCKDGVLRLHSRTTDNDFLPDEYMAKFDE